MKLEAAIPLMMTTLHEAPDEWIDDECQRAFAKIGSEAVVEHFAKHYTESEWDARMSIAFSLDDIHSETSWAMALAA